jgi:hypothetical protein
MQEVLMSRPVSIVVSSIAVIALSALSLAVPSTTRLLAAGQSQAAPPHDHTSPPAPSTEGMKMHQQMMSDMKAADGKLDQLAKAMNGATGDARINAIADVVNELVNQHKSMHARMDMMMSGGGMSK